MSRVCGYEETTTGHPCDNVVEDYEDHCRAGHPCPPVATDVDPKAASLGALLLAEAPGLDTEELLLAGEPQLAGKPDMCQYHAKAVRDAAESAPHAPKPTLSQETLYLLDKAHALRSQYEERRSKIFAQANPAPTEIATLDILLKEVRKAEALARGKQTEELLADCLGPGTFSAYQGTPTIPDDPAEHNVGMAEFQLIFSNTVVFRGRANGAAHRHWYVRVPCMATPSDEDTFDFHQRNPNMAYVRLKNEGQWYGPERLALVDDRRIVFMNDLITAAKVTALCPWHRKQLVEGKIPATEEPDDEE